MARCPALYSFVAYHCFFAKSGGRELGILEVGGSAGGARATEDEFEGGKLAGFLGLVAALEVEEEETKRRPMQVVVTLNRSTRPRALEYEAMSFPEKGRGRTEELQM